jgi:predicted ATPase
MKESIHIKNFGPLKDVLIEDIKPFTVLIGESGSGKSVLMKVIALFRWIYKMYNIRSYLRHSDITRSPFSLQIETLVRENSLIQYMDSDTEVVYAVTCDEEKYEIKYSKSELRLPDKIVDKSHIIFSKINYTSETRSFVPLWMDKGAAAATSFGFYFNEIHRDFQFAVDVIKELELDFLNIKFYEEKLPIGKKYYIQPLHGDKYKIEYKNASSGMQNAIPLELIAEYFSKHFSFEKAFRRSVLSYLFDSDELTKFKPVLELEQIKKKIQIHIEEPELGLFPDAQCDLIDNLVRRCFSENKDKIELFIATHSPYIINHLNLLIKAWDTKSERVKYNYDELAVYQVEDGKLTNLKIPGSRLINANPLSDTINDIYDEYAELGK